MSPRIEITDAVIEALETLQSRREYRSSRIIRGPIDTKVANGKDTYNVFLDTGIETRERLDFDGFLNSIDFNINIVFSGLYVNEEPMRELVIEAVDQVLKLVGDNECVSDSYVREINPGTPETNYVITNIVLQVDYYT